MIRRSNKIAVCLLALSMSMAAAAPAFAMPPYDHIPEGCSEETWYRMQDDLIEWDEIGDLVQYYNPAYTQAFDSQYGNVISLQGAYPKFVKDMQNTLETAEGTLDVFKGLQKRVFEEPDDASIKYIPKEMLPEAMKDKTSLTKKEAAEVVSASVEATRNGISSARKSIQQSADNIEKNAASIERALLPLKKQMTQIVQNVILTYEQTSINRETVKKQVALYQTALDTQKNMKKNGLATDYDVLSAEQDLKSAQDTLTKLDNGLESMRRTIGLQLGWDGTKLPEIGAVPEPEIEFVDTTNPDADKTAAIMHNKEVRDAGKVQYSSSTGFELRDKTENEKTGLLVAKMDSLYADMKQKKALYETAQTTLKKAELTKNAAEQKYQLGMLGRAEYEGQQLAYTSYEAAYQLAKLNLFQSINTYRWAVDGYVTLD